MNDLIVHKLKEAEVYIKSGLLPYSIKTPEQAVLIMMKGKELGIQPLEALSAINVIQGKPTISPQLMLALARRSKQLEDIKIEYQDDGACSCTIKRKGNSHHTEVFGPKEAQAMGLSNKDNYKKQAMNMYKWRALSACLRVVFPDVVSGVYTHEELAPDATYDEDGIPEEPLKRIEVDLGTDVAKMAERGQKKLEEQEFLIEEDPTNIAKTKVDMRLNVHEKKVLMTKALLKMTDNNLDEAKELLKQASTFVNKDGKTVEGVDSTDNLKGKLLNMTWHNVKRMAEDYQTEMQMKKANPTPNEFVQAALDEFPQSELKLETS